MSLAALPVGLMLGALLLAIGVLALFVAITLRRVVPTNMNHIVQSGKKTVIYGKDQAGGNVYYEVPFFIPMFGVSVIKLPVSNFDIPLDGYQAYDSGRLPFRVDVRAFFVIADADKAAKRVSSFEDLKRQLTEILRGSVRSVLAGHALEEILGSRTELALTFTKQVEEQLPEWGVITVKSIEFMDMKDDEANDSTVIHDIMAKDKARISRESRVAIAENHRQAEIAEVDAAQQVNLRKQEATQTVGQRTALQEQEVGIARETAKQATLAQAKVTAQKDMEVRQVNQVRQAEIDRDVAKVGADRDKAVLITNSEAAREQAVIAAGAEKDKTVLIADGQLAQALKQAEGITARGEAEGSAKRAVGLAEVAPQIALAEQIGENEGYQTYLVSIEQVKANASVGIAQAAALEVADIKIIANGGDISGGFSKVSDIFTSKGGTTLAGFMTALAQTPEGKSLLEKTGISSPDVPSAEIAKSAPPRAPRARPQA